MADTKTKIKVAVKWGSKDTKSSIKIKAKTLGGALKALEKRDEWGKFDGKIGYAYKADSDGLVTAVAIKPSYTIQMPSWDGYKKAPKACQTEWDRMWKALEKHEDGHRLIHLETLAIISDWLDKAEDLTVADFKSTFEAKMKEGQKNQDKFDSATGHGEKKGVTLTIASECE